eukprot:gene55830-biopygen39843
MRVSQSRTSWGSTAMPGAAAACPMAIRNISDTSNPEPAEAARAPGDVLAFRRVYDDGALLDYDFREVKVAQAIIANARHVILVADSTKFERTAPVRIAHLSQVHTFVTDNCFPPNIRKICRENNVQLIETAPVP